MFEEVNEVLVGLVAALHGAEVALGADAFPVVDGAGFEPDGLGLGAEEGVGAGVGDEAAADGEDEGLGFVEEAGEDAAFEDAVGGFALEFEDFGDGHAGFFFDEGVELDEGDVEFLGEAGAEGGFSGAAEAEEGDAEGFGGVGFLTGGGEEVFGWNAEGFGEVPEADEAGVGEAILDVGEEADGEA